MDVYAIVTEKIINLLEQGVVPWRRPWTGGGLPRNVVSKKPYRGINHFLLSASKYVSAVLVDHASGERTRRTHSQRRGEHDYSFLEGRRSTRRDRAHETKPNPITNPAAALSSAIIASGTSSSASYRNAPSKSCRRLKRTSTIRSKR